MTSPREPSVSTATNSPGTRRRASVWATPSAQSSRALVGSYGSVMAPLPLVLGFEHRFGKLVATFANSRAAGRYDTRGHQPIARCFVVFHGVFPQPQVAYHVVVGGVRKPFHLADMGHLARAVGQACHLHDDVDG